MRPNSNLLPLSLFLCLGVVFAAPGLALPVKYKTTGTYVDSSGGQHPWSVNDAHTLIWDGEPFIPVGGAFASRYISLGATQDNYRADVEALETLKSKGITDVILKGTGPITSTDPAAWQKIVDYLDSNGFTYGVEMNDGPTEPLKGYVVSPNVYRLDGPSQETVITRQWPDVDSAIFIVMRTYDLTIRATGGAVVKDGKVSIYLPEPLSAGETLIVYPRKSFSSTAEGGMGDLWSGFGEYRDRVLAFFRSVKFGQGLRFFLEPFTSKMDFTGDMLGFVPDSTGFRLGFEAYLTQKYTHEGGVNAAWGMNENIGKIEGAARLMPMWTSAQRVPFAYDKASAHLYPVDVTVSKQWLDLVSYRDLSAQQYMNTIADVLHKQVADVPVIFKSAKYHRVYANPFGIGGFDGLGAEAYGSGDVPVTTAAGPAYSLAEESGKTTWFIVAATQTTADEKTFIGYPNENVMAAALDFFREVGCKGFYVDSLQALPQNTRGNFSLLNDPQQIDWLSAFSSKIDNKTWTDFKPEVIYYPSTAATGACVKRLGRDSWWLPSLRVGKTSFIGDGLSAYTIIGEDRSYLWSNSGAKTVTLKAGPTGMPSVAFPAGAKLAARKGGRFSIELTDSPTVLRGMDLSLVFPFEVASAEIERLAALIPQADKLGLNVEQARMGLDRAKTVLDNDQPLVAHSMAQKAIEDLLATLGKDLWNEGEEPLLHNCGSVCAMPGASDGLAMVLDTDQEAPLAPYSVSFRFSPEVNASYEIWIAGTAPSDASPVSYTTDDTNWQPASPVDGKVETYAPGLAWYKIGAVNAFPGNQTVTLRIDGRRPQDNRYYFAIDAVVLSPRGFTPDGVTKPF